MRFSRRFWIYDPRNTKVSKFNFIIFWYTIKTILNVVEGIEILEEIVWEVSNVKYTIPPQKMKKLGEWENGKKQDLTYWSEDGQSININALNPFPIMEFLDGKRDLETLPRSE